jgi:hypothetical protein
MPVVRLQQKSYQLEDRVMEGYAMAYRHTWRVAICPGQSRPLRTLWKSASCKRRSKDCRLKTFQLLMTPTSSRAHGALFV